MSFRIANGLATFIPVLPSRVEIASPFLEAVAELHSELDAADPIECESNV